MMLCGESGGVDFKEEELQLPSNLHKSCPLFLPAQQGDTEREPGEQGWYLYKTSLLEGTGRETGWRGMTYSKHFCRGLDS